VENEEKGKYKIEEVRELLALVSDFLKNLREPLESFIRVLTEGFSGDKIGKEVASFYRSLIDSGLDAETAKKWTERFLDERLKSIPSMSNIGEVIEMVVRSRREERGSESHP